ncbi:uncharacterized protein LOC126991037 [Eriocheir sinensis]|uniref:uncharacterized protein LOC126991037 n=1 Tax=Eriocheir sinensis TaxID=95602 RepID=UPI0021CAC49D|nr:uncharacterized protein LOC126991037 [Eriocheir sinensis]
MEVWPGLYAHLTSQLMGLVWGKVVLGGSCLPCRPRVPPTPSVPCWATTAPLLDPPAAITKHLHPEPLLPRPGECLAPTPPDQRHHAAPHTTDQQLRERIGEKLLQLRREEAVVLSESPRLCLVCDEQVEQHAALRKGNIQSGQSASSGCGRCWGVPGCWGEASGCSLGGPGGGGGAHTQPGTRGLHVQPPGPGGGGGAHTQPGTRGLHVQPPGPGGGGAVDHSGELQVCLPPPRHQCLCPALGWLTAAGRGRGVCRLSQGRHGHHPSPGHHADLDRPHGFCFYNNVVVAANRLGCQGCWWWSGMCTPAAASSMCLWPTRGCCTCPSTATTTASSSHPLRTQTTTSGDGTWPRLQH